MRDTERLRRAIGKIVVDLSADARLVWDEMESDAKRVADGEDVTPELPSGFDDLPPSEQDSLLEALDLTGELLEAQSAENEG